MHSRGSSLRFWALAIFLAFVFLTGGASRNDVQSLLLLYPVSVLTCAFACLTLRREHFAGRRLLVVVMGLILLLGLVHIVPLPPAVWHALPGRDVVVEIDRLAGLGDVWRPITLAPANGWHGLVSLATPLAVLLLGVQLSRDDLFRLLPVLIGLAALSAILGFFQAVGGAGGPLYLYRITNYGSAVGLFANRNHAATLLACLFPMLALFAATAMGTQDAQRRKGLFAAIAAIVLVPLLLVTGSRSGVIAGIIGLIGAGLIYRRPVPGRMVRTGERRMQFGAAPILGAAALLSIGLLTVLAARAEALTRLFSASSAEDERAGAWRVGLDMLWSYFPAGSGSGSFTEAFEIVEPDSILDPTYLNRAHNDWLETGITFGLPGMLLLAAVVIIYLVRTVSLWRSRDGKRRSIVFARMASIGILIIAIGSIGDYPLRTPIMMAVMMVYVLWFAEAGREAHRAGSASAARSG